jgi:hypothetical protein
MHLAKSQDSASFDCKLKSQRLQFNLLKDPLVLLSTWVDQPNIDIDIANDTCIRIEVGKMERFHNTSKRRLGTTLVENDDSHAI